MKKILFIIFFHFLFAASAQENQKKEFNLDNFIEQTFQNQDEDLPYEDIFESLFQYYQSPLDLNKATREELASLFMLTESQINNFLQYRASQKKILSIYELQVINDFDLPTIYKILPFVEISMGAPIDLRKEILTQGGKYFLMRYDRTVERKDGFKSGKYNGSPDKFFGRVRASKAKEYSVGLTFEQDAGEDFKWSPSRKQLGIDFWSYHLMLENKRHFKKLLIGDYQLQFGQGLVSGAGFSPGKTSESVLLARRYNIGIRPYTSMVESGFFRGFAATYQYKFSELTAFYSNLNEDASIKTDSLNEEYFSSTSITGLHRTDSEMSARNKLNRQDYGGNLNLNLFENQLQIGLTYLGTIYSVPVLKRPTTYNQYDFAGLANYNYSINYSFIRQNYNLFGEIARSKSNGTGIVSGLIASLSAKTDLAVVYRKYERDFHSFYGNAFGENIKNSNEEGLYIGLRITPIKKIILNGYFDRYRKPWLSYQCNAPSNGYEYLAKLQYNPNKSSSLYCQLRSETREKNRKNIETPLASIEDERTTKWILGINFQPLKKVLLKSRVQGSVVQQGSYYSRGMALLQEATLEVKPFKISGRYCLFDTDDYASRQYIYEKDVLYSFSFPVLYGEGSRNFILLEYKYSRSLDLWIKASQTTYNDRDSIGSGTESIKGNKKTDIRIQLKYNF